MREFIVRMMNNHRDLIGRFLPLLSVILLTLSGGNVSATEFETGDQVRISNLHTIEDDFFVWSYSITNDGVIDGDAFLGGYEIVSNGEVTGSENVFAYTFNHNGTVDRSLRVFANNATVGGHTERSLLAVANSFVLEPDAIVNRDASIFGSLVHVDGRVRGDLNIRGERVTITGTVDGNVDVEADHINIDAPAVINGNLTYLARKSIEIDTLAGVSILGTIAAKEETPAEAGESGKAKGDFTEITFIISKFLAAFLFGIILIALFRRYAEETYVQLKNRFGMSAVSGLLTFIITVFCIGILVVALILVVIGLAVASKNEVVLGSLILVISTLLVPITSFVSVSGFVLFYMGKIVVAMLVGCMIWRWFKADCAPLSKLQLLVGMAVLTALFEVPYIGFALYLLASIIGAGGVVLGVRNCHRPVAAAQTSQSPAES